MSLWSCVIDGSFARVASCRPTTPNTERSMYTSNGLRVAAYLLVLGALTVPRVLGAQASLRQARVEVTTPKAPTPVLADGKRLLGYELHVTNFDPHPLKLRSVEVFSSLSATRSIASLRDSLLGAAVQIGPAMQMAVAHGSPSSATDSPTIGPGERAIVFLWLTLSSTEPTPTLLRHRFTFSVVDSAGQSTPAVIDSLVTPVSHETVLVLGAPLRGGDWLAGSGPSNSSDHRRAVVPLNGKLRISQRFAIDWVKVGPNANTWHGDRDRNENFQVMDEPSDLAAEGIPFVFEKFTFVDFGRDYEPDKPHQSIPRRHELPVDDAVIRFPGAEKP